MSRKLIKFNPNRISSIPQILKIHNWIMKCQDLTPAKCGNPVYQKRSSSTQIFTNLHSTLQNAKKLTEWLIKIWTRDNRWKWPLRKWLTHIKYTITDCLIRLWLISKPKMLSILQVFKHRSASFRLILPKSKKTSKWKM